MLNIKECIKEITKVKTKSYCLIIGGKGTNYARSPKIWNRILKKNKINSKMIPLEVKKNDLSLLLKYLEKDKKFLGGAITAPYKEFVFNYLKQRVDLLSKKIGSVNCIFKKNKIEGINTDGLAFYETLKKNKVSKSLDKIMLLGYGGVGKAALVYLRKYFSKKTIIYCASRKNFSKNINKIGCKWIPWSKRNEYFKKCNLIVNSTSLGYANKKNRLPIKIYKNENLKIVYDLIYNPIKTNLIKISKKFGLKTINGLDMNMLQAHLAIKKVIKQKIKI